MNADETLIDLFWDSVEFITTLDEFGIEVHTYKNGMEYIDDLDKYLIYKNKKYDWIWPNSIHSVIIQFMDEDLRLAMQKYLLEHL
jgi:hypothetical protein